MRYRMEDGSVVNTDKASQSWDEGLEWNGSNNISQATGSQWLHERLLRSRKGRFYKECESDYQGSNSHVEWVDDREAVRWILLNGGVIPEDLKHLINEVEE